MNTAQKVYVISEKMMAATLENNPSLYMVNSWGSLRYSSQNKKEKEKEVLEPQKRKGLKESTVSDVA